MINTLKRFIPVGFVFVCMSVIGCRSASPPVAFYTLTPVPIAQVQATADTNQVALKNISIGIGPVNFPTILDRPQIVTRPSPNRIELSEFNRWGGDLRQDFLNVLAQNVSMISGSDQVFKYSLSDNIEPSFRVKLDVHQFDGGFGKYVLLNVSWVLIESVAVMESGGNPVNKVIKRTVIKQPVSGNDYEALVNAQSEAIIILSREIVDEIKKEYSLQ